LAITPLFSVNLPISLGNESSYFWNYEYLKRGKRKFMQRNSSANISGLVLTYELQPKWVKNSLKIALLLVSATAVLITGMRQVLPQTSDALLQPSDALPLKTDDVVAASVDLAHPGLAIPYSFSGFSFEYGDVLNFTGRTTDTINPVFVQLLKNIGKFNNGAPPVRVGGNSTDSSWWNPNGLAKPLGVGYNITATDLASLEASLSQTGSQVILGVNLGQNQPDMAVDYVKAVLSRLPSNRILSLEIGNEPDIYTSHSYYKNPTTGATVYVRPSSYNFNQYLSEFNSYSSTLKNSFSKMPPLAGPAFATSIYGWMKNLPTFLSNQSDMLNLITYHIYPLSACSWSKPGSSTYPTISNLLSDQASLAPAQNVAVFVNQVQQHDRLLSLSETNSVSCGGTDGVSNSFASALWGTDVMFNMASVGVHSVHFHTGSGAYFSPFVFYVKRSSTQSTYTATVNPLYYGMLLFAQAATNKSRLLPVSSQSSGNVKVWATMDSQNVVRVVAINKDLSASGNAEIQLSSPRSTSSLVRLMAPSASATIGVTLGGQTFDGTTDGTPVGNNVSTSVKPKNGIYTFSLPAASAALLTIKP